MKRRAICETLLLSAGLLITSRMLASCSDHGDTKAQVDDASAATEESEAQDSGIEPDEAEDKTYPIDRSHLQNVGIGPLDYSDPALWLCRPGNQPNHCHDNIDATELLSDGTRQSEAHERAEKPAFDCFYVYPTVAIGLPSNNTDFSEVRPMLDALYAQGARFTRICEVFAPLYRQRSISLGMGLVGDEKLADEDVERAFRDYLEHHNRGRKFVLIGHSQGTLTLTRLIAKLIDPDAALQKQLISALLIGPIENTVYAPTGRDVGGTFQNLPFCRAGDQTGCIISYNTFAKESPPHEGGFGHAPEGNTHPCTDPAVLVGNHGRYRGSYFPASSFIVYFQPDIPNTPVSGITTPSLLVRDMFRGTCTEKNGSHYLEIVPELAPGDQRSVPPYRYSAIEATGGGTHTGDFSFMQDDLIDLVQMQARAAR